MSAGKPSVGIGLPVYMNEAYLRATLDSILQQSHSNITVYLVDDHSGDATPQICAEYQAADPRVIYIRNEENLGPLYNHRKVLAMADTDYFMFARGHEILPLTLVEDCLGILEHDEEVALAFARTCWIDENDRLMPSKHMPFYDSRGCDVYARFVLALWGRCEYFYGLARTRNLKEIKVLEEVVATDLIMILEMALLGSFACVERGVRYRRYHYQGETYKERIRRYQNVTLRKVGILDRVFPFARLPWYIFSVIAGARLKGMEKFLLAMLFVFNGPIRFLLGRGVKL